jgi:hypothetical protein
MLRMPTLWNAADRQNLVTRIRQVTPDAPAQWGRMTARGMMAHLHECARMALGELDVPSKKLPIRYPPLKQFIIYLMPFPKGAPTAPELISRQADDWEAELAALEAAIGRLTAKPPTAAWPDHPAFGTMTHRAWGTLVYRHTDHHLRQFGA